MRINHARAKEVFAHMLARFEARVHPFVDLENDLPQTMVLERIQRDPLKFAHHLFFSCHYMRGTMVSSIAFRYLNRLQESHSWLFEPEVVAFVSLPEIERALATRIYWHKSQVARLWRENARVLNAEWGGDPRQIFKGAKTKEDLYRRVMGQKFVERELRDGKKVRVENPHQGFGGFRQKMTSMLAYFLEATDLIPPTSLSAPVDFHHFRIYLATEMIELDGETVRYERVNALGIELAEWLQREFKLSQREYADVIWLWSVRTCGNTPYNKSKGIKLPNGRKQRIPITITWSKAQVASHQQSCGRCIIQSYCRYGVPAGPYYTTGVFMLRERDDPHPTLFHSTDLPYHETPADDVRDAFRARFGL